MDLEFSDYKIKRVLLVLPEEPNDVDATYLFLLEQKHNGPSSITCNAITSQEIANIIESSNSFFSKNHTTFFSDTLTNNDTRRR